MKPGKSRIEREREREREREKGSGDGVACGSRCKSRKATEGAKVGVISLVDERRQKEVHKISARRGR